MGILIWGMQELAECLLARQRNKFDVIVILDGPRGNGKSTFVHKLFKKIGKISGIKFRPKTDIAFTREEVMTQLHEKRYGLIWGDEMINAAHNRDFFASDQKELIKMLNMYRDHHNILAGCVPFFYDLDVQVRKFVMCRITVIRRGFAIIQISKSDGLFTNDPWNSDINKKIEFSHQVKLRAGKKSMLPYTKLANFVGGIRYGPLGDKEERVYQKIKDEKRNQIRKEKDKEVESKEVNVHMNMLEQIKEGKIDKETFEKLCLITKMKYTNTYGRINKLLKDQGNERRLSYYFARKLKPSSNASTLLAEDNLVPPPIPL